MFGWFKRNKVKTATYSVEMRTTFREGVNVFYEAEARSFRFAGEKVGKKWKQVNLGIPADLAAQHEAEVLANLGSGLKQLGYEFVIFRTGKPQVIPEPDQRAAIAELREMGMAAEVAHDRNSVKLSKLPEWNRPATFDPKEQALRMSRLVAVARGKRTPIEIVAKSDGADNSFT